MTNYTPTAIAKEISSRLRGQIARYDISQAELAALCDVSQSQFSKIIRGTRPMTVDQFAVICDALAIDMGEMLTEVEDLVSSWGLRSSPVSYVDEGMREEKPFVWSDDMLDPWGRAALRRINVPGADDDDYEISEAPDPNEYDLTARKVIPGKREKK